ncbi:MAG TPA: HD domain-containing protein [Thermogutta sp.]|nr:HD domain-containing protein [Thermogutta sp.]
MVPSTHDGSRSLVRDGLAPHVKAFRDRLWGESQAAISEEYSPGKGLQAALSLCRLRDHILHQLWKIHSSDKADAVWNEETDFYAVMALGGYGRGTISLHSDVDLLILTTRREPSGWKGFISSYFRDIYDLGLKLGFLQLRARAALQKILQDPHFCTAVLSARFLWGHRPVFEAFQEAIRNKLRRNLKRVLASIERARCEERDRFGKTVFLLQPNIKRSPGGLRDIQFIDWIRYFWELWEPVSSIPITDVLLREELEALSDTEDFLLQIRHLLHLWANRPEDVFSRSDQWLLAERWHCQATVNLLPVEVLMRDYFRRTEQVVLVAKRLAHALEHQLTPPKGIAKRSKDRTLVEIKGRLWLTESGRETLKRGWAGLFDLFEACQQLDLPFDASVWIEIWKFRSLFASPPTSEIRQRFLQLLQSPHQTASLIRGLHQVRLLENFLPDMEHARGLLQFNQYHKYTVDEHCLNALEAATALAYQPGLLGETYRKTINKKILHLAIILHDLGKGLAADHSEAGRSIARRTAEYLALEPDDAELLEFLVANHLRMNHLALRRDINDEQLIVQFAAEIGSPDVLRMMYILTATDLMAVSPDNWTAWKADLLAELYQRTMRYLSDSGDVILTDLDLQERRKAVENALGHDVARPFFSRQVRELPAGYLLATDVETIVRDLRWLASLGNCPVDVRIEYRPSSQTLNLTIATRENVIEGIFHRLTGAITSCGLEILAAQIYTLADGWIIDRYTVRDPYFVGEPPLDRYQDIRTAIVSALREKQFQPVFPKIWGMSPSSRVQVPQARVRVQIDNVSHSDFTLIEVFANDRPGLLYAISRELFKAGCFIWRAKIGTFLDQVVDVFYVTDQKGQKLLDPEHVQILRANLLQVVQSGWEEGSDTPAGSSSNPPTVRAHHDP